MSAKQVEPRTRSWREWYRQANADLAAALAAHRAALGDTPEQPK